ncbi:MAG: transposase [Desulfobacteraceae bacterium]|nr:transposase [Desulfobacteraceae bacterium]
MSRPLRIQYPGAWYHIMNRGRRYENIFTDAKDYKIFVDLLKETSEMWNIRVAAYCLMPNHYHLLVQTPDANISRSMRHLNGVYTQVYNRRHKWDGSLFRGRYKSILVSADNYLLQLVRYIHRNPLKSGIVKTINDYEWSSHKGYASIAKKWEWLHKEFILSMLTGEKKRWVSEYKRFARQDSDEEIADIFDKKRLPVSVGPAEFIDWVKGKYFERKTDDEVPSIKLLAPDVFQIMEGVSRYYNIETDMLFVSKRGEVNEPRNVAVYLCRKLRRGGLTEICAHFRMNKYSSVSSIIRRVKSRINSDRKFETKIEKISNMVTKTQDQTPKFQQIK